MSKSNVSRIPEGYTTVTPWIISRDTAGLLDFVRQAFDAVELARVVGDDEAIGHAEFRIGNAIVMGFDAKPGWPDTPSVHAPLRRGRRRDIPARRCRGRHAGDGGDAPVLG